MPFAGWELPVQYAGVKSATLAVRANCGLFDVGHMGQFEVSGAGATAYLNALVSANWNTVRAGRAAYGLLLTDAGGVMGYRLAEELWLVVVNASRVEPDERLFRSQLPSSVSFHNRLQTQAMIAVQGPRAAAILQLFCNANLSDFAFRDVREISVLGEPCEWRNLHACRFMRPRTVNDS